MGKLVKLALEGHRDSGYQVELVEIKEDGRDGRTLAEGIVGSLPPASEVYQDYLDWQREYDSLNLGSVRALQKRGQGKQPTEISVDNCQQAAEQLIKSFNKWLNDDGFDKLENILRTKLDEADEIRLIIKTTDSYLWKFPWSVWDFFEAYPKAEVAFSSSEAKGGEKPIYANPRKKVRILAICGSEGIDCKNDQENLGSAEFMQDYLNLKHLHGDREGIDCKNDQESLKRLRPVGAEPEIYEEPSLQQVRDFLWEKTWDIFFFAGHGDSDEDMETGWLYVNSKEILTFKALKSSLKTAHEKGLKIVFFNSCIGLGLARQLVTELQIPLVIAMREKVPNAVAQEFLEYFLLEYAYRELPLYLAVRKARQRIGEKWQEKLPSIDWLPVICQNPAIQPPRWKDLHRPVSVKQVGLASAVCTSLVMAARFFGMLQPLDLPAFDQLMKMRPPEKPDERILIVEITEEDIKEEKGYPIADDTLLKVLKKLERFHPRVVGVDIYRDVVVKGEQKGRTELLKYLKGENGLLVISAYQLPKPNSNEEDKVAAPPKVPDSRLGFVTVPKDFDGTIRRNPVSAVTKNNPNPKPSFGYLVAANYLLKAGKKIEAKENLVQIEKKSLLFLQDYSGGYQKLDGTSEVLLNYRLSQPVAKRVSFKQFLHEPIEPSWIANQAVLIGYTASSAKENVRTPINSQMPGVIVHAHMVSQILSAVEDNRPLLWALPWWGDVLLIWGCALAGGLLVWRIQKPLYLTLAAGGSLIILGVFCLAILQVNGGWMPLVPSALALVLTAGGSVVFYIVLPILQRE